MNTKALSKKLPTKALATHAPTSIAAPMLGQLKIKQVFVADTGDGAFTDQSVKIKPNKNGPGLVLKCVDLERLKTVIYQANPGYAPSAAVIRKGSKHFIHVLGEQKSMRPALQSGAVKLLGKGSK